MRTLLAFTTLILLFALVGTADAQTDFEDDNTQGLGMHVCKNGAMRGVDASNNRFMCLDVFSPGVPQQGIFVDSGTRMQVTYSGKSHSVHTCPQGSFMMGWSDSGNLLACSNRGTLTFNGSPFPDTGSQAPEIGHGSRTIHVCAGPNQAAIMVGIQGDDNVLLCQNVAVSIAPQASLDSEDDGTQFDLMHNCPNGFAMRGVDASNNRFFCQFTGNLNQIVFEDDATQQAFSYDGGQHNVHVCPAGSYMRGWNDSGNKLLCARFGSIQLTGIRLVDDGTQEVEQGHGNRSMHVCAGTNAPSYIVGIQDDDNKLICQTVTLPQSAGSAPANRFVEWVTLPGDPTQFTMTNATFVNVYFGPGPWNGQGNLAQLRGQTDAVLAALSNTTYYDSLLEYGIRVPHLVGSFVATPQCEQLFKPVASNAYGGGKTELPSGSFSDLAGCMERSGTLPSHSFINIFVDPSTHPDETSGLTVDMPCGSIAGTKSFDGYHNFTNGNLDSLDIANIYYFTVIPLSSDCVQGAPAPASGSSLLASVSHEIIETVSDGLPGRGWLHPIGPVRLNLQEFDRGELGDICEPDGVRPPGSVSPSSQLISTNINGMSIQLSSYWSNYSGTCTPAVVSKDPS